MTKHHIVNDVSQLNPTRVMAVIEPLTAKHVSEGLARTRGPVSIGGGRFSMGGQIASADSVHLDMRQMNRILAFSPAEGTITVEPGVRWCDIQRFVDPHGYAVQIMQTYANFTVGGSLSVNCHGRYVGLGPLVLSIKRIKLVLADGRVVSACRTHNQPLFAAAVGGYGAVGVVVEIELSLDRNSRLQRTDKVMALSDYWDFFRNTVRDNPSAVLHNADLYGPHYKMLRAVTWVETDKEATVPDRLQPSKAWYPLQRYFLWAFSETPFGKERREKLLDPLLYLFKKIHWRNYEAGYDVAELEPPARDERTYVLQEYFVPVERLEEFVPLMADILRRHRVNALNISIRHAMPDPDTMLAWAPVESFAFVLYHKQRTRDNAKTRVGVWTRELIDAVLSVGGRYYLPYQPHATTEQFNAAYPRAQEMFKLKKLVDPEFRLRNALWDKHYQAWLDRDSVKSPAAASSDFHTVIHDTELSDKFYLFLQNVFSIAPEDRLHQLVAEACGRHTREESVYRYVQQRIGSIKPRLADLKFSLPSLFKQKREMAQQTVEVLDGVTRFNGYLEIGSKGRYWGALRKHLMLTGKSYFAEERPSRYSLVDMLERGRIRRLPGVEFPLANYAPIPVDLVPDASVELVACYVGLHHMTEAELGPFLASVHRVLQPGGRFIVRDHDVADNKMGALVSLAHTVFNAGLGESWETNKAELRHFASVDTWVNRLAMAGFDDSGHRVLQANDPTANTLMCFYKREHI